MPARHLVTLLACALVSGCASTSTVSTRYQTATLPSLQSLTLAARTPDQQARQSYERACAAEFESAVDVQRSGSLLPDWYEAGYGQLVTAMHSEALLIIDITALLLSPMQLPPASALNEERLGDSAGPRYNTWQFGDDPAIDQPDSVVNVEARLIGADGLTLWEGIVQTREANDLQAIARSQCRALATALGGILQR